MSGVGDPPPPYRALVFFCFKAGYREEPISRPGHVPTPHRPPGALGVSRPDRSAPLLLCVTLTPRQGSPVMNPLVCAYELCDTPIPRDASGQRRYCKVSHRVGAYKRREAAELRHLRGLAESRGASA